ncbi:MAG: hypothetical protein LBI08_03260 [Methanomassiliicoccaceae archaeon]|jgi:predicted nucleic acid-binding Zn ribbon protein|nr:hypothetical protein [Methanomassiliicoccaceae archaeon]
MTLEDRYHGIMNDPKKRTRAFKVIWLISYSMLLLGGLLTVYILFRQMS